MRALSTVVVLRIPRALINRATYSFQAQRSGPKRRYGSQAKDADRQRKGQQKHHSTGKRTQVNGKKTRDESSRTVNVPLLNIVPSGFCTLQKSEKNKTPVSPWLLALFLFVVCGSGTYAGQTYRQSTGARYSMGVLGA